MCDEVWCVYATAQHMFSGLSNEGLRFDFFSKLALGKETECVVVIYNTNSACLPKSLFITPVVVFDSSV